MLGSEIGYKLPFQQKYKGFMLYTCSLIYLRAYKMLIICIRDYRFPRDAILVLLITGTADARTNETPKSISINLLMRLGTTMNHIKFEFDDLFIWYLSAVMFDYVTDVCS